MKTIIKQLVGPGKLNSQNFKTKLEKKKKKREDFEKIFKEELVSTRIKKFSKHQLFLSS